MIADIAITLTIWTWLYIVLGVIVSGARNRDLPRRNAYHWQDIVYWPMKRKDRKEND